jgi:AraC-like DNA-binding protein/quercetin dioxygenase-like cupin family protein
MPVSRPIPVRLPSHGVAFAESVHAPGFRMAERSDPFHKLIYVLHGRVVFSGAGLRQPAQATAGSVLCVSEGVRHQLADDAPPTLLLVCFAKGFVAREPGLASLWRTLSGGQCVCLRPGRPWGHRFESLWRAAIVEQAGSQVGHEVAIGAAAANILVSLARRPAGPVADQARRRVEAIVREMSETFYEPWSLDRACTRAAMSRRHFSKLFRTVTGRTFLEELTELRINHAAQLLRAGRHSVLGAAFSSGYGDLSHFYRLFRARHGQPPAAWAAARV